MQFLLWNYILTFPHRGGEDSAHHRRLLAVEDVDGQGEHDFCAADEAADADGFVGAVRAAEHWVVIRVGAVEAVGYGAERDGVKRESVKPVLMAGTHWMSSIPSAADVARWMLLPRSVSKSEELGTAM